ncbi:MAG: hypothetical protein ABF633_01760 [Clostridium sp.]|uniref:hypothetical protein n=1 Tax=Clostridium sp. TaxID=1506 RepID=UPI0039EC76FC
MNLGLYDFDEVSALDLILSRYNDVDYVMNLSLLDGIELIKKANIKISEDMLFQQWNMEHIFMDDKNFITFEDYKNKAFKNINGKKFNKEEIHKMAEKGFKEADEVRKLFEKGGYVSETL